MLHLTAALREAIARNPGPARNHVAEAKAEAASLGEPDGLGFGTFEFGPTNVGVWEMNIAAELGEPVDLLGIADDLRPDRLPIAQRRANYHAHRGRALTSIGGKDDAVVAAFLRAEEQAPQWFRSQPAVRDAVQVVLNRTRRPGMSPPLRRLAHTLRLEQ